MPAQRTTEKFENVGDTRIIFFTANLLSKDRPPNNVSVKEIKDYTIKIARCLKVF